MICTTVRFDASRYTCSSLYTIRQSRLAIWVATLTGVLDARSVTLQRAADLIQNRRIVDRRRHRPRIAVCNFLDRAAEDFSRARLRQPCHGYRELERAKRTDLHAHHCDNIPRP